MQKTLTALLLFVLASMCLFVQDYAKCRLLGGELRGSGEYQKNVVMLGLLAIPIETERLYCAKKD